MSLGVVGYGRWGQMLSQEIYDSGLFNLSEIWTFSEQEASLAKTRFPGLNIFLVSDVSEVRNSKASVLYGVLPNFLHQSFLSLVHYGQWILVVEKPAVTSSDEIDWYESLLKEEKERILVAHRFRHHSLWKHLKFKLANVEKKAIRSMDFNLSRPPFRMGVNNWRYDITRAKSWTLEELIHYVDIINWCLGSNCQIDDIKVENLDRRETMLSKKYRISCLIEGIPSRLSVDLEGIETVKKLDIDTVRQNFSLDWRWSSSRVGQIATMDKLDQSKNIVFDQDDLNMDHANNLRQFLSHLKAAIGRPRSPLWSVESVLTSTEFCLKVDRLLCV